MKIMLSDRWLVYPHQLRLYLILSLLFATMGYIAVEVGFYFVKYPVSLIAGQLAFSAAAIKAHLQILSDQGTFDAFIRTQVIDFAWIIGLMSTLFFSHVAIARAQLAGSKWQRLALSLAVIAPCIAASDAFENLCSFAMLAMPKDFPGWLAILYSSFAAIKCLWAIIGICLIIIQLIALWYTNRNADTKLPIKGA